MYFFSMERDYQRLMCEAFLLSGICRFKIKFFPFRSIKRTMGNPREETPYEVPQEYYLEAKKVRNIVLLVCKYTPWESSCLVRALLVQHFLWRKRIPTTIYLGVNSNDKKMEAHAWVRCGSMIVTGGVEKSKYVQVSCFSNTIKAD